MTYVAVDAGMLVNIDDVEPQLGWEKEVPGSKIRLRTLSPSDIEPIRKLCREWFPIEYPDLWYQDITSSTRFLSAAAVDSQNEESIIGLIVAENKPLSRLNPEDKGIVSMGLLSSDPLVSYILTLGVVKQRRREGIAKILLNHLITHLTSHQNNASQAIFLHVLSTNEGAIEFYRQQGFQLHKQLPLYYLIDGGCHDGCSYVRYINSGRPPWTVSSISSNVCSSCHESCHLLFKCRFLIMGFFSFSKSMTKRVSRLLCRILFNMKGTLAIFSSPNESANITTKYHNLQV